MKRIVVATDFSAEANNALMYIANCLKERDDYEIVLFTLRNPSIHAINARLSPEAIDATLSNTHEKLKDLANATSSRYNTKITPYWATGLFFDEVKSCIEKFNAQLLVMGMAKKSFEQDMLGNTTTAAINKLKTPILSIPIGAEYTGLKHILFACDIERGVHRKILDDICSFASEFNAVVEVFNVRKHVEELANTATNIGEVMQDTGYYYRNVASKDVVHAIRNEIVQSNTDMLVMVHYRYGFWQSLVHRSKTRMMASGSEIPLLSISI